MRHLACLVALAAFGADFAWKLEADGVLTLLDAGATVLSYRHGQGRNCCYLHPLLTPAGIVVTGDRPVDHPHHRGLFWAWPVMRVGASQGDSWTLTDATHRFEGILAQQATAHDATLSARHSWWVGDKRALNETMTLHIAPSRHRERRIALELRLEAATAAVTLAGAPEQQKGYGGVSIRFAPRQHTRLSSTGGVLAQDENHTPRPWAELQGEFAGHPARLRITANPNNPGFPHQWCLRHYGFMGANFPGVTPYHLLPGKPVVLSYEILLSDVVSAVPADPSAR
jgi:hypothetical protein